VWQAVGLDEDRDIEVTVRVSGAPRGGAEEVGLENLPSRPAGTITRGTCLIWAADD
jgi:hypothetical protein